MATELERLLVRIDATTENMRRELKRGDDAIASTQRKVEKSAGIIEQRFKQIGIAAGAYLGAKLTYDLLNTAKAMQQLEARLNAATGSIKAGGQAMQFLQKMSKEQSVGLDDLANGFTRLLPSVKSGIINFNQMQDVLRLANDNIKAFGLETSEARGLFLGLSQVLGSGTVTMEDMRQVTDRLPGVFNRMAQEMGMSVGQLKDFIASGKVTAQEILPSMLKAFQDNEGAAAKMAGTFESATIRMDNAWRDLADALNDAGALDPFVSMIDGISTKVADLAKLIRTLRGDFAGLSSFDLSGEVLKTKQEISSIQQKIKEAQEGSFIQKSDVFGFETREEKLKSYSATLERLTKKEAEMLKILNDQPPIIEEANVKLEENTVVTEKNTKAKNKQKDAATKLQDALNDLEQKEIYTQITVGMDEQSRAAYDLEVAVEELTNKYGNLTETQKKQVEQIKQMNASNNIAKAAIEAQKEALEENRRNSAEIERQMNQPFENAMRSIQETVADTFEGVFSGSINSAADAAQAIKSIFFRMAAEMATLQIFGAQGLNVMGAGASAAASAAGGGLGVGNLLSGASSLIGKTAIGGAINSFGAAALPSLFGTGAPIGAAVGPMQAGLLGGAGIGLSAIALPVAALALGAIFGKKKPSSKMQTGLADLEEGSILARGGLRGEKFSQENQDMVDALSASASSIAKLFGVVDKLSVAASDRYGFEYARTDDLSVFDADSPMRKQFKEAGDFLEAIFKDFADEATRKLSDAVAGALKNVDFNDAEQAIADIQFLQQYEEMINPISELDAALKELDKRFKPVIEQAKRLGLPLERINELYKEQKEAIEAAANQQKIAEIDSVITGIMDSQMAALNEQAKAATDFVNRFSRIKDSFTGFLAELTTGRFSPLHPVARLNAMRANVESLGARAQLGDEVAAEELRELLPAFLELSGEVNGFNTVYAADRDKAEALSKATLAVFTRQVSIQEEIANAAAAQIQTLQDGFNRMIAALQSGRDVFTGATANAAGRNLNEVTANGLTVGQTEAIYRAVTGYTGATGAGQLSAAVEAQGKQAEVIAAMRAAGAKGFASGGMVMGGGGVDTIPAMLTSGEFVVNRTAASRIGMNALQSINSGGASSLDGKMDSLIRITASLVKVTAESGNVNAEMLAGVQGQLADMQRSQRLMAAG